MHRFNISECWLNVKNPDFWYQQLISQGQALNVIKKKMGRKDVFAVDEQGQTALHVACLEHTPNQELVKFLISKKAEVDARDNEGWTPLHCACSAR